MSDAAPPVARRWRGLEREERDEQRRRRLLDAALDLFGTDGYAATSIEALCARANVATRSLYELFGGREPVLTAIYDEIIGDVAAGVWAALDADTDDVATLVRGGIAAYLGPLVRDERKGRITQLEVVGVSPELERHRRDVIRAFAAGMNERLELWTQRGTIDIGDPGLVTLVMAGGASETLVDHLVTPQRQRRSLDELTDELTRVWLLLLR